MPQFTTLIPIEWIDKKDPLWREWLARHNPEIVKAIPASDEAMYFDTNPADQDTREDFEADRRHTTERYGHPAYQVTQTAANEAFKIHKVEVLKQRWQNLIDQRDQARKRVHLDTENSDAEFLHLEQAVIQAAIALEDARYDAGAGTLD